MFLCARIRAGEMFRVPRTMAGGIEGFVETENQNCKNAMAKLHFQHEGTMKDREIKNAQFISLDIYAKLKTI